MIDALIPFLLSLLDRASLTTGLSAQHSKALCVSRFLGRCCISILGLSLAPVFAQSKGKKQDCEIIPLLPKAPVLAGGLAATCTGFYLSIYFPPFFIWLSAVDIWSLNLAVTPQNFRKKEGEKDRTLILNPSSKPLQETLSFSSFLLNQNSRACHIVELDGAVFLLLAVPSPLNL